LGGRARGCEAHAVCAGTRISPCRGPHHQCAVQLRTHHTPHHTTPHTHRTHCTHRTPPTPRNAHPLLHASQPSLPTRHSLSDTHSSLHTPGSAPVGKPEHTARSTAGASRVPRYCLLLMRTVGMIAIVLSLSPPAGPRGGVGGGPTRGTAQHMRAVSEQRRMAVRRRARVAARKQHTHAAGHRPRRITASPPHTHTHTRTHTHTHSTPAGARTRLRLELLVQQPDGLGAVGAADVEAVVPRLERRAAVQLAALDDVLEHLLVRWGAGGGVFGRECVGGSVWAACRCGCACAAARAKQGCPPPHTHTHNSPTNTTLRTPAPSRPCKPRSARARACGAPSRSSLW
jgi:hypothetical protein